MRPPEPVTMAVGMREVRLGGESGLDELFVRGDPGVDVAEDVLRRAPRAPLGVREERPAVADVATDVARPGCAVGCDLDLAARDLAAERRGLLQRQATRSPAAGVQGQTGPPVARQQLLLDEVDDVVDVQ